jgi:hypothetical protein
MRAGRDVETVGIRLPGTALGDLPEPGARNACSRCVVRWRRCPNFRQRSDRRAGGSSWVACYIFWSSLWGLFVEIAVQSGYHLRNRSDS